MKLGDCCVCGKGVYEFDSVAHVGEEVIHHICLPTYQASITLALFNTLNVLNKNIENLVQSLQPKPKVVKSKPVKEGKKL